MSTHGYKDSLFSSPESTPCEWLRGSPEEHRASEWTSDFQIQQLHWGGSEAPYVVSMKVFGRGNLPQSPYPIFINNRINVIFVYLFYRSFNICYSIRVKAVRGIKWRALQWHTATIINTLTWFTRYFYILKLRSMSNVLIVANIVLKNRGPIMHRMCSTYDLYLY